MTDDELIQAEKANSEQNNRYIEANVEIFRRLLVRQVELLEIISNEIRS